jgi:hypothetical protein
MMASFTPEQYPEYLPIMISMGDLFLSHPFSYQRKNNADWREHSGSSIGYPGSVPGKNERVSQDDKKVKY